MDFLSVSKLCGISEFVEVTVPHDKGIARAEGCCKEGLIARSDALVEKFFSKCAQLQQSGHSSKQALLSEIQSRFKPKF